MKLLVVSQYFYPENFRINDLVTELVERGHRVTVLTGLPNYPYGNFFDGYGWTGPYCERMLGAYVFRVPMILRGKGRGMRLFLNYFSFAISAIFGILFFLRKERPDAIFVFEPSPITVGIPSAFARFYFRVPVLFWVLDLWPESLSAVGAIKSSFLLSGVRRLVRWIYARCDLILVPSRGFISSILAHGVDREKIQFFPNWAEPEILEGHRGVCEELLEGDEFKILFAGNLGAAQDLESILRAADRLRKNEKIKWFFVGDGRMKPVAEALCQKKGLQKTVFFLGQKDLAEMPYYFSKADALLLSLKNDAIFERTIPGKLQSYLAAEKPILGMISGEAAKIIREAQAGLVCDAGDDIALAKNAETMVTMRQGERVQMGENGKEYFLRHFERKVVFDSLESMLKTVVKGSII